jgi:hypothetical protein
MPRASRDRQPGAVYHIKQSCIKGSCLFRTEEENQIFLTLLTQLKSSYNFKLYGVSLQSGSFELLIYPESADISSIMRSLMIQYANIKNQKSPLCKERYKSKCLSRTDELLEVLIAFHPVAQDAVAQLIDSPWSMLGISEKTFEDILIDPTHPLLSDNQWLQSKPCMTSTLCCVTCMEQGKQALKDKLQELQIDPQLLHKHKDLRNKLVKWFRQHSTLTLKEIGLIMGDLSESTISKILKNS